MKMNWLVAKTLLFACAAGAWDSSATAADAKVEPSQVLRFTVPALVHSRYYLRSKSFVKWISEKVVGAKMPRAKMSAFWRHENPLPTLEDQKRIALLLGNPKLTSIPTGVPHSSRGFANVLQPAMTLMKC